MGVTLFELGLILVLLAAGGPPPNDACDLATPIAGEGIFSFDNRFATEDLAERCDLPADPPILRDVWYCWTAPQSGLVMIDTCGGTSLDSMLQVYEGCECPVAIDRSLTCNDDACFDSFCRIPACGAQSNVEFNAGKGQSYLVRLGSTAYLFEGEPGAVGTFVVSYDPPEQTPQCSFLAPNTYPFGQWNAWTSDGETFRVADAFTPAVSIDLTRVCWWGAYVQDGAECPVIVHDDAFEIRYYDDDGGVPGKIIGGPFGPFENLTVTTRGRTGRTIMGDVREYQYSATHPAVSLTAGECYWIEIVNKLNSDCAWHWEESRSQNRRAAQQALSPAMQGPYHPSDAILADLAWAVPVALSTTTCALRPTNDDCEDAPLVFPGQSLFFDSTAATTGGNPGSYYCYPRPGEPCQDFPLGDEQTHRDVWYRFTAESTGLLTVGTCETPFDTKIVIYRYGKFATGCPSSPYWGSDGDFWNDDACSTSFMSTRADARVARSPNREHRSQETPAPLNGSDSRVSGEISCFIPHSAPFCDDPDCASRVCLYGGSGGHYGYENCCTTEWDSGCAQLAVQVCREIPLLNDPSDGYQSRIEAPVRAGEEFYIRVGGFREQGGPGVLTIDFVPKGPQSASLGDVAAFLNCFTGHCPDVACIPPLYDDPSCATYDADQDGDIDHRDYVWVSFALSP